MMSKTDPMNVATVFNTSNDMEVVINAIKGGNWTDTKELIDAIVASGYGAYGNVMLDDVYVYGRSTSAYRAAAMDIWNQGNGRWCY
ncbi:MAG: hypothetical protein MJZ13_07780 [Bacteroidales bacterium]|nr:hypothetical protein [Bacteroidales bacterium]